MTKMPKEFKYEPKIRALSAFLGALVLSYIAFVGLTLWHTLERQKAEAQISSLTADLSEMEFSYLSKEAKINPELAQSLGFVEPQNIVIARKSDEAAALALSRR